MSLLDLSSLFCASNTMTSLLQISEQHERSAEADVAVPCCRGDEILICKAWPVTEDEDEPSDAFLSDETVSTVAMTVVSPCNNSDAEIDASKVPPSPTTSLAVAAPPDYQYEQKFMFGTIGIYFNFPPLEQKTKTPPKPLEWYTPKRRTQRSMPLRSSYRL